MSELKTFSTKIETWGSPISIRAYDKKDAEGLTRALFKIPTGATVTATEVEPELQEVVTARPSGEVNNEIREEKSDGQSQGRMPEV